MVHAIMVLNYKTVFMGIDDQLISKNTKDSEAEKAGEFREATRGGNNAESSGMSLREATKKASSDQKIKEANAPAKKSIENPFLKTTDELLKSAWENLIPSWGLTLIWIDIHVFLSKALGPSAFREMGEEWIPDSIKKLGKGKIEPASALLRIVEGAGCGCLNLGCLFLVIAFLSIIALVVSAIGNPLDTAGILFGSLWHYLTGGK